MSRRFAVNITAHRNRDFDSVLGEIAPGAFRFPILDLAASRIFTAFPRCERLTFL
jgi:hypothetical protein